MNRFLVPFLAAAAFTSCILVVADEDGDWFDDEDGLGVHLVRHSREASYDSGEAVLTGSVRTPEGEPVEAHVAAVRASGSYSVGVGEEGAFALRMPRGAYLVRAQTEDGRVAVAPSVDASRHGVAGLELVLEEGATLLVSYEGERDSTRCAVFQDGLRLSDATLRRGDEQRIVVPPGRLPIVLYDGDVVHATQEVRAKAGETVEVVLRLDD